MHGFELLYLRQPAESYRGVFVYKSIALKYLSIIAEIGDFEKQARVR